ncbi:MAG: hypothetical protein LQ338_003446 [Usnochroma carphineum]|nr:MAG: hypothetical protein LQ338_003446 [Usnochroma carphineum]
MVSSTSSTPPRLASPAPPSLETLVSHLVASKRSLSSVEQVWRGHEIIETTRFHLEASVTASARSSFLRSGIATQLQTLNLVHAHSKSVEVEGAQEYEEVFRTLDEADQRLKATMHRLRSTMVESRLRPESDQPKCLFDFVDEGSVEKVLAAIQDSAKAAQAAHQQLVETNLGFHSDVSRVKILLESPKAQQPHHSLVDEAQEYSGRQITIESPIPDILQDMETRSREMADNLESLVKHFDLCLMAIKHTEGGGDAAIKMTADLPDGAGLEEDMAGAPKPISEQERQEMLDVLAKDAEQVEEVVMEIRDHVTAMEAQLETVVAYLTELQHESSSVAAAFRLLEDIGSRLHAFVAQSQVFVMRWDEEKAKVNERMEELSSLEDFYLGYLSAYDNLLVEIGRRQFMEQQMEKVVQDATRKLDILYEEDSARRESFKQNYGDYLPMDIWPGLTNPPLQYETKLVDGVEKVPDISKSVIQRAIRRVEGSRRQSVT